jgi:probable addiction module antidote protein
MSEKFTKWSVFDDLKTDEDIASFLEACLEDNDYDFFFFLINIAARARGINKMAQEMGTPRESLYKSFSGNHKPNFETIFKAIKQLGFTVHIVPNTSNTEDITSKTLDQ